MFGPGSGGGWGLIGGPSNEHLLEKERPPPARPLPLDFPNYIPPRTTHPLSRRRMISFRSSLLRLRKPSDVSDGLLCHLNIHLDTDVLLSSLVPDGNFSDRPFLYDSDLDSMLAELDIPNEDAFREVMRFPPLEGRKKPRLAYSRNFFAGLEDMSHYYDDSKDWYYEVEVEEDEEQREKDEEKKKDEEKGRDEDGDEIMTYGDAGPSRSRDPSSSQSSSSKEPETSNPNQNPSSITPTKKKKGVYKGLRLGNASSIPPTTRTATVRNLLKMATHKFACRDYDPSSRERLRVCGDVNVPAGLGMYSFCVVKTPSDVKMARGRFVEGPVVGVSVRYEVAFGEEGRRRLELERGRERRENEKRDGEEDGKEEEKVTNDLPDFQGAAFDLAREIGSLLTLALQRNREGKGSKEEVHARESEGWWWAKVPRWGNGPTKWGQLACEVYEDQDPSWSPVEREMQMEKRRSAEEEMRRLPGGGEMDGSGRGVKMGDLIAKGRSKASAREDGEGGKDGDGDKWGRREERAPPKKRNRIVDRPNENGNGSMNGKPAKKGEDGEGEMREGKRVMYVGPMRKRWYKDWESVRPNSSTWDEKMIYKRIGSVEEGWDEVFQVSCVNHHVALMKMRVSKRYVQWLEGGDVEKKEEGDEEDVMRIWRSEWFDMFDVEQRKAFLLGMWRLMCWVCRYEIPRQEWEKMERLKEEASERMRTKNQY